MSCFRVRQINEVYDACFKDPEMHIGHEHQLSGS
jgi:hypothetical protein